MFDVYLFNSKVGVLGTERGRLEFAYAEEAVRDENVPPLSIRLPKRQEPFGDTETRAFFENLLPEEEFRRIIAATLRIAERNTAGLLGAIAGECAGAVSVWPRGEHPRTDVSYRSLNDDSLRDLFAVPEDSRLAEAQREGRLSLAGAQSKLALRRAGSGWQLPQQGAPSTHIIKRTRVNVPHLVENEFFCMRLAAIVGLPVPEVEYLDIGIPLFVVRRFDRKERGEVIERLHQEDLCQATCTVPAEKYEVDGGPGLVACASVIRDHSALPISDLPMLVRWVVFNYLIGNEDAHGKNLALLYTSEGLRLAPFYDLVSSTVYKGLSRKAAMAIGGERRYAYVQQRHWDRLAAALAFTERELWRVLVETADALERSLEPAEQDATATFGAVEKVVSIASGIRDRIVVLRRGAAGRGF
jgi:serine/threonine-protein kinase HipA